MTQKKIDRIISNFRLYGADTKIGRYVYHYIANTGEITRSKATGGLEKVVAHA